MSNQQKFSNLTATGNKTFSGRTKENTSIPGSDLPNTIEMTPITNEAVEDSIEEQEIPLFEYQKEGIEFLLTRESQTGIIADQMGLGKTRQVVVAGDIEKPNGKLVLCPASIKTNWEREIEMVRPEDKVFIVQSGMDDEDIPDGKDWYIINYDLIKKHKMRFIQLSDQGDIELVMLDEAHYIKGKSQRARATLQITETLEYVYAITGTPLLNRPIELYNILKAIRHPLGTGTRKYYSTRYCNGHLVVLPNGKRYFDDKGSSNLGELRNHLRGWMLRRKKKDVLDLPKKMVTILDCEMSKTQRAKYEMAWDDYIHWVKEHAPEKNLGNILMAQHLVELQKLKQVCSRAKVDRVVSDIKNAVNQDEKVIVFTQYKETIKQITEKLWKKPRVQYVKLDGSSSQEDRNDAVDRFQNDDKVKVFVGNIQAAGVGITLTEASIVIFADMDWSPENHTQAEDRAHRIGQESMVNVYYYVATGTIEEDIIDVLNQKKSVIEQILEGKAQKVKSVSMAEEFMRRMHGKLSTDKS